MSIVVFVNPHSRANRRDPGLARRFALTLAEGNAGRVVAPQSLDELADEARRLADGPAGPPSVVGIHGGDGTVHRTVGALIRGFAAAGVEALPPLAILTGGTMNVVARSLGIHARPERLLAEMVEDARVGRAPQTVARRCLQIGEAFGFVFGSGLMVNFLEEYYSKGGYGTLRALLILGRTLLSALVGGSYARQIFRRFRGRVWVEGQALPWTSLTSIGAATVREVGLGFKLNHRADEDPDRFSVLAIHAGPVALAADLAPVHRGRGIAPRRAWSAVASSLVLEPEDPRAGYTIDGDLYPGRERIEVAVGPSLRFVLPRGSTALARVGTPTRP